MTTIDSIRDTANAISMARAQGAVQALEMALAVVSVGGSECADALAIRAMLEGARGVLSRAEDAWATEAAEQTFCTTHSAEVLPRYDGELARPRVRVPGKLRGARVGGRHV